MPIWNEIRLEIAALVLAGDSSAHDKVRRKYLRELADLTGRPVIVYGVDFINQSEKVRAAGSDVQITLSDKEGLIEVMASVPPGPVDLLIHSPGGSPTAAEALVALLRFTSHRTWRGRPTTPHSIRLRPGHPGAARPAGGVGSPGS